MTMAWIKELRFALRTLVRYPWTHGAAVVILAFALGAVLCMLSLVDELLWSPLPGIERPDRIASLFPIRQGSGLDDNEDTVSLPNMIDYRERGEGFESVAWFGGTSR